MLLGIVYHAALAYAAGFGWMIEDPSRSTGLYLFQAAVHGFRMPLFFVVSGFFTALLWRKRGLAAVWKNRLVRIVLPCLLGLVTLVPAMNWASGSAMAAGFRLRKAAEVARAWTADATVWSALASGDLVALNRVLARKPALDVQQPESGIVPLTLVAGLGHATLGSVDWSLLGLLLTGSLPGIWLGTRLMRHTPERLVRSLLSLLLAYAGTKLIAF